MANEARTELLLEETACALCDGRSAKEVATGRDYEYWTSELSFTAAQCEKCGHLYLNPRPVPECASLIYPSNYYTLEGRHTTGASFIVGTMKRLVIRNRLADFRELLSGKANVLEIGCGDCSLLLDIGRRCPNVNLTGIDLTFTAQIREECAAAGLALLEGRVEDVDLPKNTYDLIIMNQLIEHLWDPVAVIRKVAASLRDGGMVSIETVNVEGYDRALAPKSHWGAYYFPRHLNFFGFDSLRRLLALAGLATVKQYSLVAPINWAFTFHGILCPTPEKRDRWVGAFFTDRNPLCLGLFTVVDLVARGLGFTTSNQKTIAQKRPE